MKAFRFSLVQVLRHKHWLEEEAKKRLASAMHQLRREKEILEALEISKSETLVQFGMIKENAHASRPQLLLYMQHLEQKTRDQAKICDERNKEVSERSRELAEAMKTRKVLEKLKERQYADYLVENRRKEAVVIDEISSQFWERNRDSEKR